MKGMVHVLVVPVRFRWPRPLAVDEMPRRDQLASSLEAGASAMTASDGFSDAPACPNAHPPGS